MVNYMAEVAKMLGVEIGEEFEIQYPSPCSVKTTAVFSDDGFKIVHTDAAIVQPYWAEAELHCLLNGTLNIKRKPWKPKYEGRYYSIGPGGVLEPGVWLNDFIDITMYRLGNCYRTVQEAEANRDKWVAFYESDELLEV